MDEPEKLPVPLDEGILRTVLLLCILLGIASCAMGPETVPVTEVREVRYPASQPTATCPDLPVLHGDVSIEDFEDAWIDAQVVHAKCVEVIEEWQKGWEAWDGAE